MFYRLNYEAQVCPVFFVQLRQSLVNALSTELWSTCLPCLLCPIKTLSGKCSINWIMKHKSALSPSSNQDNLWWMLYRLNYEAQVCPFSFVQSRQSLVNALSTELCSTCLPCLLRPIKTVSGKCSINWTMKHKSALSPSSNQGNLWWMLHQLNYVAHACPFSFVQ